MFRGLSDAASCLSPQFATTGHPRRSARRRMHRANGCSLRGLQLRIVRSAMASFAIHPQRQPVRSMVWEGAERHRPPHGAAPAHVGAALPDFALSAAAPAGRKIRAAAACGWTCARAVLRWPVVSTATSARRQPRGGALRHGHGGTRKRRSAQQHDGFRQLRHTAYSIILEICEFAYRSFFDSASIGC